MHADPKSAKKTDGLTVFFVLLGSALEKAASKMFVKLTPNIVKLFKKTVIILSLTFLKCSVFSRIQVKALLLCYHTITNFKAEYQFPVSTNIFTSTFSILVGKFTVISTYICSFSNLVS